jgi:ferredoxin-thioredoxin reductase catalytic subunit
MKVISIVLLVAVAAVYAFPAEETADTLVAVEAEPVEVVAELNDGLVRDKRQYGGENCGR